LFIEPKSMIRLTGDEGESVEMRIHRICRLGFRIANIDSLSVPVLLDWNIRFTARRIYLDDPQGDVVAYGKTIIPSKWISDAQRTKRVMIFYGFGFELRNSKCRREVFASKESLGERFRV